VGGQTIGIEHYKHTMTVCHKVVTLHVWDRGGADTYGAVMKACAPSSLSRITRTLGGLTRSILVLRRAASFLIRTEDEQDSSVGESQSLLRFISRKTPTTRSRYWKKVAGVLLVFDLSSRDSLDALLHSAMVRALITMKARCMVGRSVVDGFETH
jgi:hypothetical protein